MVILAVSMPGKIYMLPLFKKIGERVGSIHSHTQRQRDSTATTVLPNFLCAFGLPPHTGSKCQRDTYTNKVGMGALFVTHLRSAIYAP